MTSDFAVARFLVGAGGSEVAHKKRKQPNADKTNHHPAPRWITREVAQHLRASERSVANYRDKEGLPHIKINARKILYDPAEVEAWARKRGKF